LGINANIVFVDVMSFTEDKIETYRTVLAELVKSVESSIFKGMNINTNLITDRIALDNMNNCGAGDTSITLAPNGKFYPCPAFYYDDNQHYIIGDIENGLDIKNKTLYKLEYAPLCKRCDAFQCKRCVWLNKKLTYEINTPSRQQCVMSHLEREAGATLLDRFHKHNILLNKTIEKIDYIDPFDNYK
ncbi:MAG: CXXX repeat peptide maturase, partial [Alphaproteobacteria bacterium]|nr:CXXX repeat peptide maturase [Alphaproteobacteria bacterium]